MQVYLRKLCCLIENLGVERTLQPPPSMLFMKAKKAPTYIGVKSIVSAATCRQVEQARPCKYNHIACCRSPLACCQTSMILPCSARSGLKPVAIRTFARIGGPGLCTNNVQQVLHTRHGISSDFFTQMPSDQRSQQVRKEAFRASAQVGTYLSRHRQRRLSIGASDSLTPAKRPFQHVSMVPCSMARLHSRKRAQVPDCPRGMSHFGSLNPLRCNISYSPEPH